MLSAAIYLLTHSLLLSLHLSGNPGSFPKPLSAEEDKCDIALREVAEGKLISEIDFDAIARAEDAKTKWAKHAALRSIFADDE